MDFVSISPEYQERIKALHDTKIIENKKKVEAYGGFYNTDDHGFIYFEDFTFEPEYPDDNQFLYGAKCIGENLRRFLSSIPVYIHPASALAGAWAGQLSTFAKIDLRPEDQAVHLKPIHEKYNIRQPGIGGMNHLAPDMIIGLQEGYSGLLEKIRYYKAFNNPADTDFYDGEEAVVLGILSYIKNHAEEAKKRASATEDVWEQKNYTTIAKILENLLTSPPKNFREACQFIAIFQSVDRTYYMGGALGQLDELLRPYYEQDIRAGILTDEAAIWIISSLFYNDTHYSQLGGQTPDGSRELTSKISFLILQAAHTLAIPYNLAVRVFEGSDDKLLRKALECILEKGSGPSFSLSQGIEEGFIKQGHPRALARMRAKVGCNWVALPGIEYPLQDVTRICMAEAFVCAFDDLSEDASYSLERLWDRFTHHLGIMIDCVKEGYDWHYEVVSRNKPELVLNLFCHGPIERGLNSAEGGVDIINLNADGIALATVADSFAAIEQRVVKEARLSWEKLAEVLDNNYEDEENIRLMMKNIPRFGHPDSLAGDWAIKIKTFYVNKINESPTPKHKLRIVPGMFSHGDIFSYGKELPAMPNGRKSGDPISHSSEPDPGFAQGTMSFSPTLKANAVASVQPGWGNSAPLHLDIDANMIKEAGSINALCALIHSHNQMGGTLINLNLVTPEQIRMAHEDPDSQPDLVVRVTGYSAFFSSLSKEYRQQVVDRYLSKH